MKRIALLLSFLVASSAAAQPPAATSFTGGTLTSELVCAIDGIEFQATDTLSACSTFTGTNGGIYYDDSEGKFKKCEDGVLTDLDTSSGTPATADISDVSVTQTELAELEAIDATTISAAQWTGLGGATTAGIALWDDANAVAQLVTLGLTATASEINTPLDGASVTLAEFQQLETLGATTVEAADWTAVAALVGVNTGDGLANVVEDVTPQLGAMLDVNTFGLGDGTLELLLFTETGSAVNEITIANAATGNGPTISSTGGDAAVDINLAPKGAGDVAITSELQVAGTGTSDFGGPVTATSFTADPSASPSLTMKDSDASAGDINAQLAAQATDAGDGTEDIDVTLSSQQAGALVNWLTINADGPMLVDGHGNDLRFGDAANYVDVTNAGVLAAGAGTGSVIADAAAADTIDTITEIAAALKSGADGTVITGTAGASGNCAEFNVDGDLVDSGAGCGGGSSEWTDLGTVLHPTETGDDVALGNTALVNAAKLSIDGDADQVQLTVQENSAQTDAPFIIETSAGAETATVEPGGLITTLVGLDAIGAVDMDYGSADVTDHTFTTDGTGDGEVVLPADSIGPDEIDSTTGAYDLGGVTSFEIPNSAAPTVNAAGEVAIDTTITSHDGLIKYYDGATEMVVIAIPTADLTTTDAHVPAYNTGDSGFTMEAQAGGSSPTVETVSEPLQPYTGSNSSNPSGADDCSCFVTFNPLEIPSLGSMSVYITTVGSGTEHHLALYSADGNTQYFEADFTSPGTAGWTTETNELATPEVPVGQVMACWTHGAETALRLARGGHDTARSFNWADRGVTCTDGEPPDTLSTAGFAYTTGTNAGSLPFWFALHD